MIALNAGAKPAPKLTILCTISELALAPSIREFMTFF